MNALSVRYICIYANVMGAFEYFISNCHLATTPARRYGATKVNTLIFDTAQIFRVKLKGGFL